MGPFTGTTNDGSRIRQTYQEIWIMNGGGREIWLEASMNGSVDERRGRGPRQRCL
jgi:hypothetical protein